MADQLLLEGTALIANLCENDDKRLEAPGNKRWPAALKLRGNTVFILVLLLHLEF